MTTTLLPPAPSHDQPATLPTAPPPPPLRDLQSMTRSHLANERTFLAWMRTAVSLFALGLAAAVFYQYDDRLGTIETALSLGLVTTGVIVSGVGYRRYRLVHERIEHNEDCGRRSRTVGVAAGVLLVAGIFVGCFILALAG